MILSTAKRFAKDALQPVSYHSPTNLLPDDESDARKLTVRRTKVDTKVRRSKAPSALKDATVLARELHTLEGTKSLIHRFVVFESYGGRL